MTSAITVAMLIVTGLVILLGLLISLNDAGERTGWIALGSALMGQMSALVVSALYANRQTRRFIEKNNLNGTLAMIGASFAAIMLGLIVQIATVFISVIGAFAPLSYGAGSLPGRAVGGSSSPRR